MAYYERTSDAICIFSHHPFNNNKVQLLKPDSEFYEVSIYKQVLLHFHVI